MNKIDLIDQLKDEGRISKNEAATIVDLFFGKISDTLASGERVEIRGLCSFFCQKVPTLQGQKSKNRRDRHRSAQKTAVF